MADDIRIKLPDGSEKQVPKGTTALDIAKSISPRLADAAIVAKVAPAVAVCVAVLVFAGNIVWERTHPAPAPAERT